MNNLEKIQYLKSLVIATPRFTSCGVCEGIGLPSVWQITDVEIGLCTDCANLLRASFPSNVTTMKIDVPFER